MSKTFSNSMINSTVSKESAPKSFVKLASRVISDSSTPSLSTMICLTLASVLDIFDSLLWFTNVGAKKN